MKRVVSLIVFAVVALTGNIGRAEQARGCTLATLRGTYLLTARLDAPGYAHVPGVPQVVGGLRTFDGAGNLAGIATVNAGGTITQNVRAPGVYMLNADCTGTLINAGTRHYDIFVAGDGSELVGIRTDPGVVEIIKLKRVGAPSED